MYKQLKIHKNIKTVIITSLMLLFMLICYEKVYAKETVSAPKELQIFNPQVDTILLKWNTVQNANQYYVYMSTSKSSNYELVCSISSNKLLLKGLKDNTTYYFKVYANGNGGLSNSSNIVSGKNNIKGIDVSYHNGIIDWQKVKASGLVDFAIIRCGYGDKDLSQDDIKFVYNVDECSKAGIPMGVYLYSYALNMAQAQSEADHVLQMIGGKKFDYKVWYDLEDSNTTGKLGASTIGDIAQTFCNSMTNAGFDVGIYANKYWFTSILTDSRFNNWPKWVAQYNNECTYDGVYIMWQYTSDGAVPGVDGRVDVNYAFTGVYADMSNASTYDVSNGFQHLLPAPGNVKTTIVNKNKVVLTWNKSESSEKYIIYRSTKSDTGFVKIAETTKTAFTDSKIPSGVSYYYKILAQNSKTTSEYSDVASAKLYVNQPSSLTAEVKSYNKIKLTWAASSDATGYEIYRSRTLNGTYSKIATTKIRSYVNSGVITGQRYYYKVRAIKAVNGGTANVYSQFTNVVNDKAMLNQPTNVKATSSGYNTLKLTFSPVVGATSYEIYRSISKNGTYKLINITNSTTFYSTNLTTGFTYYYKVKAIRQQSIISKSAFSEKVWRTPKLGTARDLKVTSESYGTAGLSWLSVNGANGYMVYRCSKLYGTYTKFAQVNTNQCTDTNRNSGKTYYYKVRAYRYVNGKLRFGEWSMVKKATIR